MSEPILETALGIYNVLHDRMENKEIEKTDVPVFRDRTYHRFADMLLSRMHEFEGGTAAAWLGHFFTVARHHENGDFIWGVLMKTDHKGKDAEIMDLSGDLERMELDLVILKMFIP